MLWRATWFGLALIVAGHGVSTRGAAEPLSAQDFDRLHALIKPRPGEARWAQIPWVLDLWEARTKAAAEGKPIFFWSVSGEPLGCT
jgi:hypothetical protein